MWVERISISYTLHILFIVLVNNFLQEVESYTVETKWAGIRLHSRVSADFRIRISYVDASGKEQAIVARTRDISPAGLSAYVSPNIPVGTEVTLDFTLPVTSVPMCLIATIRNIRGFRHGMQFHRTSIAQKQALRDFCDKGTDQRQQVSRIDARYPRNLLNLLIPRRKRPEVSDSQER